MYLDYAATTPCDPNVIATMTDVLTNTFYHPHADHPKAKQSLSKLTQYEAAIRYKVQGNFAVWTSGATEANNTVLLGCTCTNDYENTIVTCATEHKSVLEPCRIMKLRGTHINTLSVDNNGQINWGAIEAAFNSNPYLVSLMLVNNETGVMHPIEKIGQLCQSKGILFHVDAAQGFGKVPINMQTMGIDFLTISGHKIYGPPGIGALVLSGKGYQALNRKGLMFGGKPQHDIRPGTPPVALCAGFVKAIDLAYADMQQEYDRVRQLKNYCWQNLQANIPNIAMNGGDDSPFILNFRVPRVAGQDPLAGLNEQITFSTSAACNCGGIAHVMVAMGIRPEDHHILRLSFGRYTTQQDIETATQLIIERFKNN